MIEYEIRKANKSDIDKLAEIYFRSWEFAYRGIISDSYLDSITLDNRVQRFKQMDEIFEYIYMFKGEIIGCSRLIDSRDADLTNCAEIQTIYFLPEFTGQGHGKVFLEWLIEKAKSCSYSHIIVWCLEKNERARHAYEKVSFYKDIERTIEIGGTEYPEVRYRLDL